MAAEESNFLAEALMRNQMDLTKGMFFSSSFGIGLLVCLMMFFPVISSGMLILFSLTILSFLVCLSVSVYTYRRNGDFIVRLRNSASAVDQVIPILDRIALISFVMGLCALVLIGIVSACQNMQLHALIK